MAERVLIIRLSALGDIVFASPLIMATRRRWPDAHISWLVEPAGAPLLRAHPELDAVITWPKEEWKTLWRQRRLVSLWQAVREFRRLLRAQQFSVVFDVQGLLKSAVMGWLTGASRRLALQSGEPTRALLTARLQKPASDRIGSEYLAFAQWASLEPGDFAMQVVVDESCRQLADEERLRGTYAVLAPFTTRPQKHWHIEGWRALAAALRMRGLRVLLLGGPDDVNAADDLVGGSHMTTDDMDSRVGMLRLDETAAVIERAALLVGVDTGLTHMGIAFGVPTVALFGSTCPYRRTTRANARVIYHDLACAPCRRRPTCDGRFDCLRDIAPDEVLGVANEVMMASSSLLIEPV